MTETLFRFEGLEIWQGSADLALLLFKIADDLESRRLYRFAEQLRAAGLSTPNNIHEGSGSTSDRDFAHFLNIARRSTFENASMIMLFHRKGLVPDAMREQLLDELAQLCKMITAFSRTLRSS